MFPLFSFRESAELINPKVQKGLFLFAVSNSVMDPIVYGKWVISLLIYKKRL